MMMIKDDHVFDEVQMVVTGMEIPLFLYFLSLA